MKAKMMASPMLREDKSLQQPAHEEVQLAQAHQREGVGGEHQIRLLGETEDRRDGIKREQDVGRSDRDHHQQHGVRTRRPFTTAVSWDPWYSRVVGKNRSTVRTTMLFPGSLSASSSSPRSNLTAVKMRRAPNR